MLLIQWKLKTYVENTISQLIIKKLFSGFLEFHFDTTEQTLALLY